jgi:hypothetical protein
MSYTGYPTGLVHGLQIDLDESIGHVEPKNGVNRVYDGSPSLKLAH